MTASQKSQGYPLSVTDELLQDITQKIAEHFRPEKVILFGSHVWGKPHRDSDVDLLVIMESNERPAKRAAAVSRICRPRYLPMDILVRTPQEIAERLQTGDFFIHRILEKGRALYENRSDSRVD